MHIVHKFIEFALLANVSLQKLEQMFISIGFRGFTIMAICCVVSLFPKFISFESVWNTGACIQITVKK